MPPAPLLPPITMHLAHSNPPAHLSLNLTLPAFFADLIVGRFRQAQTLILNSNSHPSDKPNAPLHTRLQACRHRLPMLLTLLLPAINQPFHLPFLSDPAPMNQVRRPETCLGISILPSNSFPALRRRPAWQTVSGTRVPPTGAVRRSTNHPYLLGHDFRRILLAL